MISALETHESVESLTCGGPDAVSNLQWQTIRDVRLRTRGSGRVAFASL
jgi:hypothetical protein